MKLDIQLFGGRGTSSSKKQLTYMENLKKIYKDRIEKIPKKSTNSRGIFEMAIRDLNEEIEMAKRK